MLRRLGSRVVSLKNCTYFSESKSVKQGLIVWLFKGLRGVAKLVQVLFNSIEAAMVLTLVILK